MVLPLLDDPDVAVRWHACGCLHVVETGTSTFQATYTYDVLFSDAVTPNVMDVDAETVDRVPG